MEIRIDQSTIGSVTVNSGIWGMYAIEGYVSAGIHKVAIAFTNDYYNPPSDRNLFVDSIFITSSTQLPYRGTLSVIPGTIQAEDFDTGGEGVAYRDLDASNNGGRYRPSEGVDIETTTDTGGGYNVGWMEAGEWLQYTVNVATAGTYDLDVRVAANGNGGTFHIEFNGVNKTGSMTIPNTGGWQVWRTIRKTGINLGAGLQVMKIVLDADGPISFVGNINNIVLSATTE